ncbi:hypothetical protein [uncultured Erythrobacter sp.]|uniref:hypothetical protein n=1 Tax=uncultured Erythrobacter sp. TaxID=263913 RepID=UPI00260B291E|nr:hypothetical protein [uncultured Erythrobacter sp.]
MTKKNLHSNAQRRQLAISLYEDLNRFLEGKSLDADEVAVPLADSFNSRVERYDLLKALSLAILGGSAVGSMVCLVAAVPTGTTVFFSAIVLATAGFLVSASKQVKLPVQFTDPNQIEWSGSDKAHAELQNYLNDVRSQAQLVHRDGSVFESVRRSGPWYLAVAKSVLSDRSKEVLKLNDRTAPQVFRANEQIEESAPPDVPALTATDTREQDRNWLRDFSREEFQSLVDEFGTFDIPGKLQPWSRHLLELGKKFSDKRDIKDGRKFRSEFLKHLRDNEIRHSNGRYYEADHLAAALCMTNNSTPSACRRFLTNQDFRIRLRLQQSGNQHELPLARR